MASKRIAEPNRLARAYWEEIRAGITPEEKLEEERG